MIMVMLVANLLRGFGPVETSGTVEPPASPTLAVVDNGNGTGAVATISGGATGAVNTVFAALVSSGDWSSVGSRSGNGTVSLSLSLGQYVVYVRSVLNGQSVSNVVLVSVTSPASTPAAPTPALTFREQRSNVFYDVFLDSGIFAEVVTVIDPGRPNRQVYGKKVENESDLIEAEFGGDDRELLLMRFGKLESHVKGGIANPTVGMAILREGETEPFAYTGKKVRACGHSWTLVFNRPRSAQVG